MDIEKIATNKIENEILKNSEYFSPYINSNDKTPFWDGNIFIYNNNNKTKDTYLGKIDVQVKGRKVQSFDDNNTFRMDIETLKGYQKEIKGTLLFVVDIIDINNLKLYYCNLLPVDLHCIFKNIKDEQKTYNLKLREIKDSGPITFKSVCFNFYTNSNKQANIRIIDESEFGNIETMRIDIINDTEYFDDYISTGDIYTYARLKDTNEEVAMVKPVECIPFNIINRDVKINDKKYYSKYKVYGNKEITKVEVGPLLIDLKENQIHFNLKGKIDERIKSIEFILNLFRYRYIQYGNNKIDYDFNDEKLIQKNIKIYEEQLKYFKNIKSLFKYFNTKFDIEYEQLTKQDIVNLKSLLNLYNGIFDENIKDLQKYYTVINKFKFIFVTVRKTNKNKIINYYSDDMLNNVICTFDKEDESIINSVYSYINTDEIIGMSNFNSKIILNSYKDIELCDEIYDSINNVLLVFVSAYDKTNNKDFINLADKLSQINCKNRNNDIDIINSKQIKYRKKGLTTNDKKILSNISKKIDNQNDYQILCCIDILLNNNYNYEENYKKMSKKDKSIFKNFPICNLINKN